ncbi:type II secretion system protein N [Candidatus Magnetominusculus xianensis]|uniref:General secretion pathway protein GspC n=1 Tax=Candidatus Magnetominusculus xianensis TaxID=1748249 RepID=A0ABR5SB64_9BACT|nr:type II secretion system protein N [Candidatus Magnetominusculus xianensis]KWT75011.1 general secretion pathway protein GspC [Candidatus Magnetominusculus xianensis]MBF0404942.1 PDZ domain-containing protein [Nitrospirota bacterium]
MNRTISISISKKMHGLYNALLAALLFFTIVFATRDCFYFISNGISLGGFSPGQAVVSEHGKPDIAEYASIVSQNPFGIKHAEFKSLLDSGKGAAAPSRLRLLGTISGTRGTGYAFIEDDKGNQELFKVGAEVFNSGVLSRVTPNAVYLSGGLKIDITEIAPTGAGHSQAAQLAANSALLRGTAGGTTMTLNQGKVLEAIENPKQLMTDARLQPRHINGKQEGFVLQEVKPGGLYDQLGLNNGDVLLSVNRYDITDPETALAAFAALKGAAGLQLEILRGQTKLTLNYLIK